MNLLEILRPDLVLCQIPERERRAVFQKMGEALRKTGIVLDPQVVQHLGERHEGLAPLALGRGMVLSHLRTEKVSQLVVVIATTLQPVLDFETLDGEPVRLVTLFLIPKKHSDLYLRMMAVLLERLSHAEILERVLAANSSEEIRDALAPSGEDGIDPYGEVVALLSNDGTPNEYIRKILQRLSPADVADLLDDLTPEQRSKCLTAVEPRCAAEIASHMRMIPLVATARRILPEQAARIFDFFPATKAADVLQRMEPAQQSQILRYLTQQEKKEIQSILRYPPHTAGGVMNPEVLSAEVNMNIDQARHLAAKFPDRRQIDLYVVSSQGRLLGCIEIHELLTADPALIVSEIMKPCSRVVDPYRDQEELRRLMSRDNLHSIPVAGKEGDLLGVVTQDDLLDVVEQEANEDLNNIVGMQMVDPLHTPLGMRVRLRIPWLLLTLGGELFIALVMAKVFRPTLEKAVVLAAFIPAIMATGGNVGLQATTMVIRGLSMGTLKSKHTKRIIYTEVRLGVILGLTCGLIAAAVAYLINIDHHEVAKISVSVFLAMMSATLATSLVGTLEPLALHRLKMDPATACGPFVTMFNDIFGSLVYMLIAMLMNFSPVPPG